MRGHLDGHIRPPAWLGLAAGTARGSYSRLIRHGTLLPRLRAWRETPSSALGAEPRPRTRRSECGGTGCSSPWSCCGPPWRRLPRGCGVAPCRAHRRFRHRAHPVVATHPSSGRDIGRVRNAGGGRRRQDLRSRAQRIAVEHRGFARAASLAVPLGSRPGGWDRPRCPSDLAGCHVRRRSDRRCPGGGRVRVLLVLSRASSGRSRFVCQRLGE